MKNNLPIGVFDSGVGGLSVLKTLKTLLPNENFIFLADQMYVPYGEKSKKELIRRGLKIIDYLINYHNIKMLVVACNTTTCNAIDEFRKKYSLEEGKLNSPKVKSLLLKYLKEVKDSNADYLVLDCTHYPFLKKHIHNILNSRIKLIDGNKAIAKRTQTLLVNNFMKNNQKRKGTISYFSTGNSVKFSKVATELLNTNIETKKVKI